jgi:hypothetical protein
MYIRQVLAGKSGDRTVDKIARAKKVFYNTLRRNKIEPEQYLLSPAGASVIKLAGQLAKEAGNEKRASLLEMGAIAARRLADPKDPVGLAVGPAVLGGIGSYGLGSVLGKLTSPTSTTIGNLQKKELISEYEAAIEELKNRMEAANLQ